MPVLVLVALAAVIGLMRDPTYESEARVSVGRVDAPVYTLDDVLIANTTLARTYGRVLNAEPVMQAAAADVGISTAEARESLSGSPIPGSSLIEVAAERKSKGEAIALANAGAAQLIRYIEDLNRRQESTSLLNRFRRAGADLDRARVRLQRLQRNRDVSAAAVARARVNLYTAEARAEATRINYRANEAGGLSTKGLLQLAVPAVTADSDRSSVLQRLILIGLGAGLLLGFVLALLRENRALLARSLG